MITTLAQYASKDLLLPDQASTFGQEVDWLFWFITWVSVVFTVLIMGALVWFLIKYRMKPGDEGRVSHGSHHNNALEITWSVIPLLIVLAIFVWGFRGFLDMSYPPTGAYEVWVDAKKWNWTFQYPEGKTSDVLVIPAGQPILLTLNSQDVLHSFWVPAFRNKKDAVPGRYNQMWFEAQWDESKKVESFKTPAGDEFKNAIVYDLYCTEYCGTKHSWMRSSAIVLEEAAFQEWLKVDDTAKLPPIEAGNRLYLKNGCNACHSADGSAGTGPTLRNLFGKEEQTSAGVKKADEAYIAESIRYPGRAIVQGYSNAMPAHNLTDQQISNLVAWIKSISPETYGKTPEEINKEHGWTGAPGSSPSQAPSTGPNDTQNPLAAQQPGGNPNPPSQQAEEQTGRSEQGVEPQ